MYDYYKTILYLIFLRVVDKLTVEIIPKDT